MFSEVHTAFGNIFLEVDELMQCEIGLVTKNVENCKQSLAWRVEKKFSKILSCKKGSGTV